MFSFKPRKQTVTETKEIRMKKIIKMKNQKLIIRKKGKIKELVNKSSRKLN